MPVARIHPPNVWRCGVLVRMTGDISGTRDGVRWPARGETVELPDAEAASLVAMGMAAYVEVKRPADEQATAEPAGEKRPARRKA